MYKHTFLRDFDQLYVADCSCCRFALFFARLSSASQLVNQNSGPDLHLNQITTFSTPPRTIMTEEMPNRVRVALVQLYSHRSEQTTCQAFQLLD